MREETCQSLLSIRDLETESLGRSTSLSLISITTCQSSLKGSERSKTHTDSSLSKEHSIFLKRELERSSQLFHSWLSQSRLPWIPEMLRSSVSHSRSSKDLWHVLTPSEKLWSHTTDRFFQSSTSTRCRTGTLETRLITAKERWQTSEIWSKRPLSYLSSTEERTHLSTLSTWSQLMRAAFLHDDNKIM